MLGRGLELRRRRIVPGSHVLFALDDIRVPDHQTRIDEMVKYADRFFASGLARWGHKNVASPFRYTADGHATVTLVRGSKPAQQYKDASSRLEALAAARKSKRVDDRRQVWWVLAYVGDPPTKFPNYREGFDPRVGGWSVCNDDSRPAAFKPTDQLGDPVGAVDPSAAHKVSVDELAKADDALKTWFVFANGASTGNGRQRGKGGAISKPYRFDRSTIRS